FFETFFTSFPVFLSGVKLTVALYLPFVRAGSLTETLPLAFLLSLTFTDLEPTLTFTVPVGFERPLSETLRVTLAREPALTFVGLSLSEGLPLATLTLFEVTSAERKPVRFAVTRTLSVLPTSDEPAR